MNQRVDGRFEIERKLKQELLCFGQKNGNQIKEGISCNKDVQLFRLIWRELQISQLPPSVIFDCN